MQTHWRCRLRTSSLGGSSHPGMGASSHSPRRADKYSLGVNSVPDPTLLLVDDEEIHCRALQKAFEHRGNVSAAARAPGMYRRTLQRELHRHPQRA